MLTPGRRNLPARLVYAAVFTVAVGLGASLLWLGWTWRHPQAFHDSGGWGVGFDKRHVGDSFYAGMSYPRHGDGGHVTLHGGHVNFTTGADIADVELLVCTIAKDAQVGAIGTYGGDTIHDDCDTLVPIRGQRLDLHDAPLRQQVVLKVTLTRPGTVRIADVTVDYSYGWQRGSQRIGGEVVMSTEIIDTWAGASRLPR